MVFILDGCSFHYAHIWSKHGFRFVEGIWLHRKSSQIQFFISEKTYFTSYVRIVNEQPSNIKNHNQNLLFTSKIKTQIFAELTQ